MPQKRAPLRLIVKRKEKYRESVSLSTRFGVNYTAKKVIVVTLDCGHTKSFTWANEPKRRTACNRGCTAPKASVESPT